MRRILERYGRAFTALEPDLMRPVSVGILPSSSLSTQAAARSSICMPTPRRPELLGIELVGPRRVESVGPIHAFVCAADSLLPSAYRLHTACRRGGGVRRAIPPICTEPARFGASSYPVTSVLTHLAGFPSRSTEENLSSLDEAVAVSHHTRTETNPCRSAAAGP